jgi:hypothetical protein
MRCGICTLTLLLLSLPVARADEAEDKAVAFVLQLKGRVLFDGTKKGKPVYGVDLDNTKISDADLKELAPFKQLELLAFNSTPITDAGLKELAGFTKLRVQYLNKTTIGDAGLKKLAALKQLQELYLSSTQVGDAGLKELGGLQQLRMLYVTDTQVTKEGVAELEKALPKCRIFHNAK